MKKWKLKLSVLRVFQRVWREGMPTRALLCPSCPASPHPGAGASRVWVLCCPPAISFWNRCGCARSEPKRPGSWAASNPSQYDQTVIQPLWPEQFRQNRSDGSVEQWQRFSLNRCNYSATTQNRYQISPINSEDFQEQVTHLENQVPPSLLWILSHFQIDILLQAQIWFLVLICFFSNLVKATDRSLAQLYGYLHCALQNREGVLYLGRRASIFP